MTSIASAGTFLRSSGGGTGVALTLAAAVALSACTTVPKTGGDVPIRAAPGAGPSSAPTASNVPRRGGGYYLDDGPGDNPPPDLELLPDAVPRIEKYASGANRPYNVFGVDYVPDLSGASYRQRGVGSWYGRKFHGQRTSNGEIYDMYAMTAAHPTLPIPCYALVTNLQNGRSVIVRVNDRGPFLHSRVMDLSYAAAYKLGYMSSGSGLIEVEMLKPADIAAGRIPVTTRSLLLASAPRGDGLAAASIVSTVPMASAASTPPVPTSGPPPLTIEALIAGEPSRPAVGSDIPSSSTGPAPVAASALDRPNTAFVLPDPQPLEKLPETVTRQGFFLQLGAFRAKAGADSFAVHLARLIDPALAPLVHVSDTSGLYRVRVGPYVQRGDADRAAQSVRAAIAQPVMILPDVIAR